MTISERGRVNARPIGRIGFRTNQSDWTLYFLADARSRKVIDIQTTRQVRLTFEQSDDAFVSLAGPAKIVADAGTIERRWQGVCDRIFPTCSELANAVFIDIRAEEIRLWIRGLTPEPFRVRSLTLCRPVGGNWHLDSEGP